VTKKVLITGGSGFIGKSLYEKLTNHYFFPLEKNIAIPNRHELDLLDSQKVARYIKQNNFDIILHCATYDAVPRFTTKDKSQVLENNLKMFFNIANCHESFGKMIYFGSGAEAGRKNWIPKMNEDYIEANEAEVPYGVSKTFMNQHANLSTNIYNLRLFGVFGKFDDWRYRFISNACCKAVLNMPITINKNTRFDYMDIEDLIKIVLWTIDEAPRHQSYNVCTGNVYDYKTIAQKINKVTGKDLEIIIKDPSPSHEYSGDNARLTNELKDFDFTDMEESIHNLYQWYSHHKHILKPELFEY